jgi:putative membrane protein
MIKRIVAGAVGGLIGTWAMSQAQRAWSRAAGDVPASAGGKHDARDWQERSEHQNSNELAAQAVASHVIGRRLTRRELRIAAPLMHYSFGAAVGALHGAYAQRRRRAGVAGARLGATLWLAADEIAMPVLGLSEPTTRRPLEMHLQSFAAHIVYGLITEIGRRAMSSTLDERVITAA